MVLVFSLSMWCSTLINKPSIESFCIFGIYLILIENWNFLPIFLPLSRSFTLCCGALIQGHGTLWDLYINYCDLWIFLNSCQSSIPLTSFYLIFLWFLITVLCLPTNFCYIMNSQVFFCFFLSLGMIFFCHLIYLVSWLGLRRDCQARIDYLHWLWYSDQVTLNSP